MYHSMKVLGIKIIVMNLEDLKYSSSVVEQKKMDFIPRRILEERSQAHLNPSIHPLGSMNVVSKFLDNQLDRILTCKCKFWSDNYIQ